MRLSAEFDVLRLRDFRLAFGASVASLLGDGVVPVALSFAVLDLTGSATDLGFVLAARVLALVSCLLIGGVVADRLGPKRVMVAADLLRLGTQAAIAVLLVRHRATIVEIAVSQAVLGGASGFFNPASTGLLPMVAGKHLRQANSLKGMAMAAGNILGPALAGVLVVATGPGDALLIDAASYGVSAVLLARAHVERRPSVGPPRFVGELREGFAEVRKRTWVWSTIASSALWNVFAGFTVLGPVVAKRSLGGPAAWAAILSVEGIGWLFGGAILLRVAPRRPLLLAACASVTGVIQVLLLAVPAPLASIVLASFLAGTAAMLFNTLFETTLQQHVPRRALSRVSSYDWFGSLALQPIGLALMGPLGAGLGIPAALYVCAAVKLATLGLLLAVKDVRRLGPKSETPSTSAEKDAIDDEIATLLPSDARVGIRARE